MASPRKRRAAFTLTEMLMAAGILGIGLTMVASIFPVAVDQSRRSRDQTMAALCARSVMARARADRNAINDFLRSRTDGYLDLNNTGSSVFPGKHVVYKPSVFLYTKGRTYVGVNAWDAGNYVARLFAQPSSVGGPWRISIFVCRSIGNSPFSQMTDSWENAKKPTPGPGTYVLESARRCAWGHLLDYVTIDTADNKKGYPAVGWTSGGYIITQTSPTLTSPTIQRVPDTIAVFHTMLGE